MIVTVNFDGKVLDTEVVETSGNLALDRRAKTIARSAGPFGRFTDAMRRKADQIVVVSRFKFTRDETLETNSHQPMTTQDQYCVMGNPVEHSKSPWIHARFAAAHRPRPELRQAACSSRWLRRRRCRRFAPKAARAATSPCRSSSRRRRWRTTADGPRPARAGLQHAALSDGSEIFGDNTDGVGLVNDIERNAGVDLAGRDAAAARRGRRGCGRARTADRGAAAAHRRGQPHAGQGERC